MAIRYEITAGALPVTVYLMQGGIAIDSNVHAIYEEGEFADVLEGEYFLYAVDDMGCELMIPVTTTTTTTETPTTTTTTTVESTTTTTTTEEITTTTTTTVPEPTTTTTTTKADTLCYGGLYNWYAVTDPHGIAPTGWHVPSSTELTTLRSYLDANGYRCSGNANSTAKSVASTNNWTYNATTCAPGNNRLTNNSTGLSILPGGYVSGSTGNPTSLNELAYIWSSTAPSGSAYHLGLWNYSESLNVQLLAKDSGQSVRLIRDTNVGWTPGETIQDYDGNEYDTVQVGTQIWTVQNLTTTHYNDGTAITFVTDPTIWKNLVTEAMRWYTSSSNNCVAP